jgi:antitoxin component of RelBE/YafQ-DinJ toxin-antitoxin module
MVRSQHVTIRLDEEMSLDIERVRTKLGLSRSDFARLALKQLILNEETNNESPKPKGDE